MDSTVAMIAYLLGREGLRFEVRGDVDACISKVRRAAERDACSDKNLSEGIIYAEDGVLHVAGGAEESNKLAEAACDMRAELLEWNSRLKQAVIDNVSVQELVDIGEGMISHPLAVFDSDLTVLASSSNYTRRYPDSTVTPTPEDANSMGVMPPQTVIDLIEDERFERVSKERKPFYYELDDGASGYCINTHVGNAYRARLVTMMYHDEERLPLGEEQLVVHFDRHLKLALRSRLGGSSSASRQKDPIHALLRNALAISTSGTRAFEDLDMVATMAGTYGWRLDDDYRLLRFDFLENVSWRSAASYIACQLEDSWPGTCSIADGESMVWLVNVSKTLEGSDEAEFHKYFLDLLSDYMCRCGISSDFENLSELPARCLQAQIALRTGRRHDPRLWYYRFDEYSFDYLLDMQLTELDAEQVCSPSLSKLLAYDAVNGTALADALVCFLRHNCNTSHTADAMFVHRTTFIKKLARIREVSGIDLENPDERLHVLLSAKLLGM